MKSIQNQQRACWRVALALSLIAGVSSAQTSNTSQINWGSLDFSEIVDSTGATLPADNFSFDLGAFNVGFTPTESNVALWFSNWNTLDRATYNQGGGVFASEYTAYNSTFTDTNNGDFEGAGISREAFIWVYNSSDPVPGTEWFLARSSDWIFPVISEDPDNTLPIEWSMSDLGSSSPVWGNQLDNQGAGEFSNYVGTADLQTFTFIPEPSSALLVFLAGALGVMRRSRQVAGATGS